MNNNEINKLIDMLSKMDKKDLEAGIAKANQILKTDQGEQILKNLKKM